MNFLQFIVFIIIEIIVHDLVVKWEIRNNIELFKDIEVPYKWRKHEK